MMNELLNDSGGRRSFLRRLVTFFGLALVGKPLSSTVAAQDAPSGIPLPDEPVEATLRRLFGSRRMASGEGKLKFDAPLIAEDGSNVAVTIEASLPVSGYPRLTNLYLISDKNRRSMLAKFSLTPEAGRALIATSVRLATSTDVRAIAEMSDGALYMVSRHVRVTVSGCDLPPQG